MVLDDRILLLIVVLLDMIAVGLVIPTIPYYGAKFNVSPAIQGITASTYGVLQLTGGPIMGRISDKYGRRVVLCMSLAGAGITYLGMAISPSYLWFFISRIPIGLLKQTESVSYSIISDTTTPHERAMYFGFLQSIFGIGFIVGPLISVYLSRAAIETPAYVASLIYVLCLLLTCIIKFPPQRRTKVVDSKEKDSNTLANKNESGDTKRASSSPIQFITRIFNSLVEMSKPLIALLGYHFTMTFVLMLFQMNLALFLASTYNFTAADVGFTMSYMGMIAVVAGFAPSLLPKSRSHWRTMRVCAVISAVSLLMIAVSSGTLLLYICMVPLIVSGRLFKVSVLSLLTNALNQNTGVMFGTLDALDSLSRVVAPALGGILLRLNPVAVSSCICFVLAIKLMYHRHSHVE